jgi:hypothetical protein
VLLLPDASGIASYRFFSFTSGIQAEAFIDSHLRGAVTGDTVLFWALSERPATFAEAVVLVMGDEGGTAHAFSFADMSAASSFIQADLSRGLDGASVRVYWASPASLRVSPDGRASIVPRVAPVPEPGIAALHRPESASGGNVIPFPVRPARFEAPSPAPVPWTGFADALDGLLDACVARRVGAIMAWRNLSREIAAAVKLHLLAMAATDRNRHSVPHSSDPVPQPEADTPSGGHDDEPPHDDDAPRGGDDPWFIPRRNWRELSDEPFEGFGSPPGRF